MKTAFGYTHELQPAMLLALQQISEHREHEVSVERVDRLRDAGLISRTDQGWRLTAAGARRVRHISTALQAELERLSRHTRRPGSVP